jgi:hypothetical protein
VGRKSNELMAAVDEYGFQFLHVIDRKAIPDAC